MEKRGHTVTTAADGRMALEKLSKCTFDLVLMDVQMPVMDGFEAAAAIREREVATGGHVPILALTASAMKGDRERCIEVGMDGFISKPVQPRDLVEAVESIQPPRVDKDSRALAPHEPDLDRALEMVSGDTALLGELLQLFAEQASVLVKEMRQSLSEQDGPRLEKAAHTLKGSLGSLGADHAAGASQALETMGRTGQLSDAEELLRDLEGQIESLEVSLSRTADGIAP